MNGFTDKQMQNPKEINKIELVLEEFDRMPVFQIFVNLKSLTLINLNIQKIEVRCPERS